MEFETGQVHTKVQHMGSNKAVGQVEILKSQQDMSSSLNHMLNGDSSYKGIQNADSRNTDLLGDIKQLKLSSLEADATTFQGFYNTSNDDLVHMGRFFFQLHTLTSMFSTAFSFYNFLLIFFC